ncbi:MAG TPA: acetyl-CoA hydrolase, partial [Planctomycetota bacterium]|nr:acetyl-CoA hydrolase [Planctomycetota bacterium]
QRLVRALAWLQSANATRVGRLRALAAALLDGSPGDLAELERMDLARPAGLAQRLQARLVTVGLSRTAARLPSDEGPG